MALVFPAVFCSFGAGCYFWAVFLDFLSALLEDLSRFYCWAGVDYF